jgi:hypothetical protein
MTLCYLDGFEWMSNGSTSLISTRWSGSGISSVITTGRTGSNGLQVGGGTSMARLLSSAQEHATVVFGAAVNMKSAANITQFVLRSDNNATTHVTIVINALDGTIRAYRGTSGGTQLGIASAVVSGADVWNSFECKVTLSDTVGVVVVKWNGVTVINLSSQDTKNAGTKTVFDAVALLGSSGNIVVDDFYVLNGDGAAPNDFIGDARIRTINPNGAGNYSQFTPTGSATNYQNVDESVPVTTDYNEDSTVGHRDTYAYSNVPTSATIGGIQIGSYAAKSDSGARSEAPVVRIGSTDYDGTTVALTTSYTYYLQQYNLSPATASAWTASEVNAAEFGIKVV